MVIIVTMIALMVPTPANAVAWGTLTVSDGATYRGLASGNSSIVEATYARNSGVLSGTKAVGTRVETSYSFYYKGSSSTSSDPAATWHASGRLDSRTVNSLTNVKFSVQKPLHVSADRVRMSPRLCIPRPWGTPVRCSPSAVLTHSY